MKPTAKTFLRNGINYVIKNMILSCLQTGCSVSPQTSTTVQSDMRRRQVSETQRDNISKLENVTQFPVECQF